MVGLVGVFRWAFSTDGSRGGTLNIVFADSLLPLPAASQCTSLKGGRKEDTAPLPGRSSANPACEIIVKPFR